MAETNRECVGLTVVRLAKELVHCHGRRSVGDEGGSIGNVPTLFSVQKNKFTGI